MVNRLTGGPLRSTAMPRKSAWRSIRAITHYRSCGDGATVFERAFSIKAGKRVSLQTVPATGRLILRWPAAARAGATLDIDGASIDLTEGAAAANPDTYEINLRKGPHTLRIVLASGETVERTVELVPGQRGELDVADATKPEPARIVLQWLASEREGALLEVDGQPRDLTAGSVRSDEQQVVIEVTPGEHAVRIVRPGHGEFQARASGGSKESPIAVTWDRPATDRPSAAELEKLRESFRDSCKQLDEYRKWDVEKDEEKKGELLKYLLVKMESEAAKLSDQPAAQLAACDESIRLALSGSDFVQARKMLTGAVGAALFSEAERQERDDLIWNAALKSTRAEPLIDLLKLCSLSGRLPTAQEESIVVDRLSNAPEIADDVAGLVGRVTELQDLKVLTREAATKAQVAIYVTAAQGELGTFARALILSEKMLDAIPAVYESGLNDAPQQIKALVDAVNLVRRKAFREAGADDAARVRVARISERIKQVRDWESQFGHVRDSRRAIADGQASPADRKLIGFWLLQLGRCADALPYLRESGEEALVQIAGPLPESAKDLATLADVVEQEAKKSKYSRFQEEALRSYVRFLRESALKKTDTSLPPAERDALQKKLSAAQPMPRGNEAPVDRTKIDLASRLWRPN